MKPGPAILRASRSVDDAARKTSGTLVSRFVDGRSIRYRLLVGVAVTALVAVVMTVVLLMVIDLRRHQRMLRNDFSTQAELIGRASASALQFDDREFAAATLALLQVRPRVRTAAIYTAKGTLFARYDRPDLPADPLPPLYEFEGVRIVGDRIEVSHRVLAGQEILGAIYLQGEFDALQRVLESAGLAFLVSLFALVAAIALSSRLQSRIVRPILAVSDVARRVVEKRDYGVRANKTSDDEIGVLVDAFNDLLSEIERRTRDMETAHAQLTREVAERAALAEARRASEERYRSLVLATSQIVWATDAEGAAVEPLPTWQAYTGQSDRDVLGDGWLRALHIEDMVAALEAWQQAIATRSLYEFEYRLRRKDGDYRWFSARGVPVLNPDGTVREWVGTCTDIHERRLAEIEVRRLNEELEQRVRQRTAELEEMNRELEAFSYSVSHDLRAPLRAVAGFSQALLEDLKDDVSDDMRRYLERIRSAALRMGQLIEGLLSLSRISRVELMSEEVDLSSIALQILRDLQHSEPERHVDVSVWDDVVARGDPRLLRVALENLLGNAWKFTSKSEHPRIELGMLREAERTTYFVRDNGAGFDMAHAGKLFGAFQRLHSVGEFQGTGIGLATVQRIVHRHGGRIWADAQPGKGAVFFFTIGEYTAGSVSESTNDATTRPQTSEVESWPRK